MPTDFNDSYAFVVYALPTATAVVPAPQMGISTVRLMDDSFKAVALAVAEYRGTSSAHASDPRGRASSHAESPVSLGGHAAQGCLAGP